MVNGIVYFVTYDNIGWRKTYPVIKIGCTTNLPHRLGHLNTASPVPLIAAGFISSNQPEAQERAFHSMFRKNRLNGEWFELNRNIIAEIRKYVVIDDIFDNLFNFDEKLDTKDLEIINLKKEINGLNQLLASNQKQIAELTSQIEVVPRKGQSGYSHLNKFIKICRA
jgi:hypothetical protein